MNLRPALWLAITVALLAPTSTLAIRTRAVDKDQLPTQYSPAADKPVRADEMRKGSAVFIPTTPWALPAFKYKSGMLATRHLDKNFMKLKTMREHYAYFQSHTLKSILKLRTATERERQIAILSPAEKYDLVLGDLDRSFSTFIWADVLKNYEHGEVPGWYGVCDGSSSASVLFKAPARSVMIQSRIKGVRVPFYIGDVKALLAYMMTTYVSSDLPIVGSRCDKVKPDPRKNECFGINPASLHQILMQMSENPGRFPYMIVDRSYNSHIWNSALLSASFSYYLPGQTSSPSERAADHIIPIGRYRAPQGSPGWAPDARYLLFTKTVLRLADTRTNASYRGHGNMEILDLRIAYVLELDEKLEVVGGEWLTLVHPSFIWALPRDYQPSSSGDKATADKEWNGVNVPEDVMPLVLKASSEGHPLFRLVDYIYQQSLN